MSNKKSRRSAKQIKLKVGGLYQKGSTIRQIIKFCSGQPGYLLYREIASDRDPTDTITTCQVRSFARWAQVDVTACWQDYYDLFREGEDVWEPERIRTGMPDTTPEPDEVQVDDEDDVFLDDDGEL